MPKVNVERAIEKGLGKTKSGASIEEVTYEGYGPGGVGLMVQVVTDNRNRTGSEIRNMLEKAGGSLGSPGSTAYLFELQNGGTYQVKVPMPLNKRAR
jgi:transcriptional/translational regulatory protein YebC/TACO1